MPTAKIKRLNYDASDTFQALKPYVVYAKGELTIHDNNLYYKLDEAEKNSRLIASLKEENNQLKEKQIAMPILIAEKDELKERLDTVIEESKSSSEYQGQVDKYQSEVNKLKSECKKHLDQIQDFNSKIKSLEKDNQSLEKNIQVLQNDKKDIQASVKSLQDSSQEKEDIKTFFSKWGTYESLKKDIKIIQFFMSRPGKEIRQKTIIDIFTSMDKSTVRNHLYRLVEKGILAEPHFKGSYRLDPDGFRGMAVDIDEIASLIFGREMYSMAVDQHQQKNEKSED